jgi:hypothetical protein
MTTIVSRWLLCAIGTTALSLSIGCHNPGEASKLADAGIQISSDLQTYYESLASTVEKTSDLEAFESSIRGTAFDAAPLTQTVLALRQRAAMARQMGDTYKSLSSLAKYNASEEVSNSAQKLTSALQGLPGWG